MFSERLSIVAVEKRKISPLILIEEYWKKGYIFLFS